MTNRWRRNFIFGGVITLVSLAACNSPTGAGVRRPVDLSLSAVTRGSNSVQAAPAGLQINSLRLYVDQAALGNGDQFGCQDCQGGVDGRSEAANIGRIIPVPINGGPVNLATEQVQPGSYAAVEIEVGGAPAAVTGWPAGQSVEITGTYNGTLFTIGVPASGSFRQTLSPPVAVTAAAPTSLSVTIALPVGSWFTSGGSALDPAVPAQLATIEANVRSAFSGAEILGRETPER